MLFFQEMLSKCLVDFRLLLATSVKGLVSLVACRWEDLSAFRIGNGSTRTNLGRLWFWNAIILITNEKRGSHLYATYPYAPFWRTECSEFSDTSVRSSQQQRSVKALHPTAQTSLPLGLKKATGAAHCRAVLAQEGGFLLSRLARKVPSSEGKKSGEERARQPGDPRLKRLSNMSDRGQITPPAHTSWASFPLLTWDSSRELSAGWSAASDGFRWLWARIYVLSHWETLSLTVVIVSSWLKE